MKLSQGVCDAVRSRGDHQEVTIRPSLPRDAPQIVGLVTDILEKEFPKDQAAYPPKDLERLAESYGGPRDRFLVAEEQGQIVGTCGVKAEDHRTAILRRLFVFPAYRGKGVGSGLLREALKFCKEKGFREVEIRTSTTMEHAIRLCRSIGFQENGSWNLGQITLVRFTLKLP